MRFTRATLQSRSSFSSHGAAARESVVLHLHDDEGRVGQGEAAPLPGYSPDDLAGATRALTAVHERIGTDALRAELAHLPSARFALETATLDLEAQHRGVSIATILGETSLARVPRSGLLDAASPDLLAEARALVVRGVRTLKLKVGRFPFADDVAMVAKLRAELGTSVTLRLDANGAWSIDEARASLARLGSFGIELVEEPTRGANLLRLGVCAVPWAADESLTDPAIAAALLQDPACAAFVLKPQLHGMLGARALALAAIDRKKQVIVTHMFDGPIGMAAACELALSLPTMPLACGIDLHAALRGASSGAIPHLKTAGFIVPSGAPGLGVTRISVAA